MKQWSLLALLLSVCAVSIFAQGTAESSGARRVAERDAAYAEDHPAMGHEREVLKKHVVKHHARARHHRVKRKAVR